MKKGGGHRKGTAFERDVCKQLSLWVSDGDATDLFWRSAMSGGRATVAHKNKKKAARHAGDITATSAEGARLTDTFLIECKHVKDLNIARWVMNETSPIGRFWDEAVGQAIDHGLAAMLICKQNFSPKATLVLMDSQWAKGFRWAKESAVARIMTGPKSSAAVLDFEQMLKQKFIMRYDPCR